MQSLDLSIYFSILLLSFVACLVTYFLLVMAGRRRIDMEIWRISHRQVDRVVYALIFVYVLVFSALSILRYVSFNIDGYDLGIFDQVVWNSLHGRLFENTIIQDAPLFIGQHFSPILLAFVPFYAVRSSPVVLLIVQTISIGVAAFPLYWFARDRIGHSLALAVVAAFFLSPALEYVNLEEFHEIALAVPLFAFATFFVLRQKYKPALICLGLSLLVKEDMAFVVMAFGVYMLLIQRKLWLGLAVTLFATDWVVLLIQQIIPYLRGPGFGAGYYFLGGGVLGVQERYGYLGSSLPEVIGTIVTRPELILQHVAVPAKIDFVLSLLVPLVFIPVAGFEVAALSVSTFATSLLSDYPHQFSIQYHYTASLLPFLFFGMVIGLQRILCRATANGMLEAEHNARVGALAFLILSASGSSYYFLAPGPATQHFLLREYAFDAHAAAGHAILSSIPDGAVIVSQGGILAHLSERTGIYEFPNVPIDCQAVYAIVDMTRASYDLTKTKWDELLATGAYEVIVQQDGYLLARRRPFDQTKCASPLN